MHLNLVKNSFYFSLLVFFSSFTFLLVSRFAPPTDKACDRRRIIFSPLQDVISYKWVNYEDYFFPRSVYRTPVTRPIALDTQLAWQDLVKGLFFEHMEGRAGYVGARYWWFPSRFRNQHPRAEAGISKTVHRLSMETSFWWWNSCKCSCFPSAFLPGPHNHSPICVLNELIRGI